MALWLDQYIRTIPDYPKAGIMFRDVTTLFKEAKGFRRAVDELVAPYAGEGIDKVVGIEARGFILGGAVAHQLSCGFVPIRKKNKLPYKTISQPYSLEYGMDEIEMHVDAIQPGEKILLVDDLIATGGTAMAALSLIEKTQGVTLGACFVIDLPDLGGSRQLEAAGVQVMSLISYAGD